MKIAWNNAPSDSKHVAPRTLPNGTTSLAYDTAIWTGTGPGGVYGREERAGDGVAWTMPIAGPYASAREAVAAWAAAQ